MTPGRVLLVAGGTGGHVLPAIAFGGWIRRKHPGTEVGYVSGTRQVELEIYRASSIEPMTVEIEGSPIGAPRGRRIKRWASIIRSFVTAGRLLKKFNPDLCVLFGGYVSATSLILCRARGIRAVVHEQNARAGRITRLASRLGVPVASGWEACAPLRRADFTPVGVPIRSLRLTERDEAWRTLGLPEPRPSGPVAAVLTGSLGSSRMRDIIENLANREDFQDWSFIVSDPGASAPEKKLHNLTLLPARWDIAPVYSAADMLIARAGASTLSEACAMGIPSVVIPWGGAADDHQTENARMMEGRENIAIWPEDRDRMDELAQKLHDYKFLRRAPRSEAVEKMYNVAESICEGLWSFAAS
ncbi:MAG: UDP-N-acetylglucosamine--N-acetylmuramyl-(pentapeptide) pyrophosphoryl-undecaprenol N-acetylglucosamine transferase [Synergistaceae bacterium]|jgi:UDP-N-acetylglucosamine--N-acetylmuramyl-(pentapeptide) pyrophosphoryl-undecaprenol N-acetylglucosamine transferase|nr:UDP-N-acetylglucosamine--N-acetylmuramyl-(pentapeptide) pyrophosphoryl-undecaprenol N-acetylglucosamine transferase [Synergistaceae bacterium]